MVVAAMMLMSASQIMEDVIMYVSTNQDLISAPVTLVTHLMVTVALVVAYSVQVHQPLVGSHLLALHLIMLGILVM